MPKEDGPGSASGQRQYFQLHEQRGHREEAELLEPGERERQQDEMHVRLGAAKLVGYLREQESGTLQVETSSIYGVALALPQIGRSCGWPRAFVNISIRAYLTLIINFVLQLWVIYLINKEELVMNKFAGRMYTCDFAAKLSHCPDGAGCVGPDGTKYTPSRLYDFGTWATRNYVRDALRSLFPDMREEIDSQVDPGEFGVEDTYCRFICVLIFVMSLTAEFNFIVDGFRMMTNLPTKAESWVCYEVPKWAEKNRVKSVHGWTELDLVKIRIAGMPMSWKVINLVIVYLPKAFLWLCILLAGTSCLLNTSGIDDMLVNSTALGFVLNIDELVYMTMTDSLAKTLLEKLESYPLYDVARHEEMDDEQALHAHHENENNATVRQKFRSMCRIIPGNAVVCFILWVGVIAEYYHANCEQTSDGTWVSKEMHLPRSVAVGLSQALFPSMFAIDSEEAPYWSMPPESGE